MVILPQCENPMFVPTPNQIREARLAAGQSQTAAAATIYRSLRMWQEWEGGTRPMDLALWELYQIKLNHPERHL